MRIDSDIWPAVAPAFRPAKVKGKTELASQTGTTPLRVLICDKDPQQRRLLRTCLLQQTDRDVVTDETGDVSEAKLAVTQGKADLVMISMYGTGTPDYWVGQILENQLIPVVMLAGDGMEDEAARLSEQGPVSYLPIGELSRRSLSDAVESAMKKWQAVKRVMAHKNEVDRILNLDPLTGLLNREAALRRLEEAMKRAGRFGEQLCVMLMDVDRIGQLNSSFGRGTVDGALQRIGGILRKKTRDTDIGGRYGGDEFLLILPHTDRDSAMSAAERVRNTVASLQLKDDDGDSFSVTVSAGLVAYEAGDDAASIMYRVEERLCTAKQRGRNRIET